MTDDPVADTLAFAAIGERGLDVDVSAIEPSP